MKITCIETHVIDAFRTNWVLVKITTDDGIYGIGEGTLEYRELTVKKAIQEAGQYLLGKNPFEIERHVGMLVRETYWRWGPVLSTAISALEAALWDIKGKALQVPVYELLGGKCHDDIPVYVNGWFVNATTPEQFAIAAKKAVSKGFKALKWDPFGKAYLHISGSALNNALECIAAVREAVGPEVDLIIECHGRFDVRTAIHLSGLIQPYNVLWMEEPVPPNNITALANIRSRSAIPVSAGERCYSSAEFADLLQQGAVDLVQPDVAHVGGLLELKKIASMAAAQYLPFAPHNPSGPVSNAMTLHVCATTSNCIFIEMPMTDVPWRKEVVSEDLRLVNGSMVVPNGPGLGIDLHFENLGKYPYRKAELRHYKPDQLTKIRPESATLYYTHNVGTS